MTLQGKPVRTAVVPAGGYGTRFLPATKSIPKEMFPLWDKPVILHVVEELVASGITDIIFIVSHHKQAIESFFACNETLEDYYLKNGKEKQVDELRRIQSLARFAFVYTRPPYGNGGCLAAVEHLIGDDPFVLVWADELIVANGKTPRVRQCLDVYEKYALPVISSVHIPEPADRSRYGMAEMEPFFRGGAASKKFCASSKSRTSGRNRRSGRRMERMCLIEEYLMHYTSRSQGKTMNCG